jgi:CDP-6-deoxy-D-xylo-4-hexulose-3-dehydrase
MRTLSPSAAICDLVEKALQHTSEASQPAPKYWYPLSAATYGAPEIAGALDSLCNFKTTMGDKTRAFECAFAEKNESPHAIMVNSGSSADLLACLLLTNPAEPLLQPGDEILVPVVTWPTQIWSAMMAGLKVKLVDVDPNTLNVDLEDLERSITPQTKAIFVVHLMGNPCDMEAIMRLAKAHNLRILEDCCEAFGARFQNTPVGNFGDAGAYSFFFSHHLVTMEGGMVTCQSESHRRNLAMLRAHGWSRDASDTERMKKLRESSIDPRYAFFTWGLNVRPTELQAAFGLSQIQKADAFHSARTRLAERFFRFVDSTPWLQRPKVAEGGTPSWFALPLLVGSTAPFSRTQLLAHLEENGVETRPMVAGNLARQPVSQVFPEFLNRSFPGADQIHDRGFYIGLSPVYTEGMIDKLVNLFEAFFDTLR